MNDLLTIRNRGVRRLATFILVGLAYICVNIAGHAPTALAIDVSANDALSGHEYPWYDAQTRSVKPLELRAGQESASQDRANLPVAKPIAKKAPTPITGGGGGGPATGGDGAGSVFAMVITGIILVGIVLLVLTFLYIESTKSEKSANTGRSLQQSIEQLPFDLDSSEGDFQTAADAAYRNGDLRKAIIYLYSHVLVTLDQNRLIRLRKGKTNRQYLNEVRRHKGVSGYFRQVMLPFESVFFGDHDMDADQFQRCWTGLNQFHATVKDNAEVLVG